jgi:hypothetical protein
MKKALLSVLISLAICSICAAENDYTAIVQFQRSYHKKPDPNKLVPMLERFFQSQVWNHDECDPFPQVYFFGCAAKDKPEIVQQYVGMFKALDHYRREALLLALTACADANTIAFFDKAAKAGRYVNETESVASVISQGTDNAYDPLALPIENPTEAMMHISKFFATGSKIPVENLIDQLCMTEMPPCDPNLGKQTNDYIQDLLGRAARNNQDIMKILRQMRAENNGKKLIVVENAIDEADGSISIEKRLKNPPPRKVVTGPKAWALAASAVLIESNHGGLKTLADNPINEYTVNRQVESLRKWWGVYNRKDVFESLEWAKNEGHRVDFETRGAYISSLDEQTYNRLLLKNIFDPEKRYEYLMLRNYYKPLAQKSLIGWDMARYICLCRWAYLVGFLEENETWELIMPVAQKLQQTFNSWQDLGENYLIGRNYWSRYRTLESGDEVVDAYTRLCEMPSSPWNTIPWDLDLTNWNDQKPSANKDQEAKQ